MEEWEAATVFAVAKMRQRYDLFHILQKPHDKAIAWVPSTKHLRTAADIISSYEGGWDTELESKPSSPASRQREKERRKDLVAPPDPYRVVLQQSSRFNYSRTVSAIRQNSIEMATLKSSKEAAAKAAERMQLALALTTPTLDYAALTDRLLRAKKAVDTYEGKSVQLALKLDSLRGEISQCMKRCVGIYESAVLQADRNCAFDELTASLGDDVPPRVGFDNWQRNGKRGFRAAAVDLLSSLHDLAMARMLLRETIQISVETDVDATGRPEVARMKQVASEILPTLKPCIDRRDDWRITWGGIDLLEHITHSLDFLSEFPLLVQWYGTSYPFHCNPFALPYDLSGLWSDIASDDKLEAYLKRCENTAKRSVGELLSSKASVSFDESGENKNTAQERRDNRIHRDHVIHCQEALDATTKDIPVWWPKAPDLSDLSRVDTMYTAFLVLKLKPGKQAGAPVPPKHATTEPSEKTMVTADTTPTIKPMMSRSVSAMGTKQIPSDYKTWLFEDDWYTSYGGPAPSRPTVSQPRRKRSAVAKEESTSARKGSSDGQIPRQRPVSGRKGSDSSGQTSSSRLQPKRRLYPSGNRKYTGKTKKSVASVKTAISQTKSKDDDKDIGGDLHTLMELEEKPLNKAAKENEIQVTENDEDVISVTKKSEAAVLAPDGGEQGEVVSRSDVNKESQTKSEPEESGSDSGSDSGSSDSDDEGSGSSSEDEGDGNNSQSHEGDGSSNTSVDLDQASAGATVSVGTDRGSIEASAHQDSDGDSVFSGNTRSSAVSRGKRRKNAVRGKRGHSGRTQSSRSASAKQRPSKRSTATSSSSMILTPLLEGGANVPVKGYKSDKQIHSVDRASSLSTKDRAQDARPKSGARPPPSPSKGKLTLKERQQRRKETLSARLIAAGIEGGRKEETAGKVGESMPGTSLPSINRKPKVARTTQVDAKVKLTRRVTSSMPSAKR